jgi:hypothetical protein
MEVHIYDYLYAKLGSMDWLKHGQSEDPGSILGNGSDYYLLDSVQIGSSTYSMCAGGDFPRDRK